MRRRDFIFTALFLLGQLLTSSVQAENNLAEEALTKKEIAFIYIHGAQQYTDKNKKKFEKQVAKLHEKIIERSIKSDIVYKKLLLDGKYAIAKEPITYYWGDQYQESVSFLDFQLDSYENYYRRIVGFFRKKLVYPLHDLIWLSRYHNQKQIVNGLFEEIQKQNNLGKEVVLLGHSAGSVVAFDSAIYRLPIVNLHEELKAGGATKQELLDLFEGQSHTCAQALLGSGLTKIDEGGNMVAIFDGLNSSVEHEEEFNKIRDDYYDEILPTILDSTKANCIKDGGIAGLVTFGSPLLVSTSLTDEDLEGKLSDDLFKHIVNKGIFWLHINHLNDFIGLPMQADELMQKIYKENVGKEEPERLGFITNNPIKKWGSTIIGAHGWYFRSSRGFSKLFIRTYEKGYEESIEARESLKEQ